MDLNARRILALLSACDEKEERARDLDNTNRVQEIEILQLNADLAQVASTMEDLSDENTRLQRLVVSQSEKIIDLTFDSMQLRTLENRLKKMEADRDFWEQSSNDLRKLKTISENVLKKIQTTFPDISGYINTLELNYMAKYDSEHTDFDMTEISIENSTCTERNSE